MNASSVGEKLDLSPTGLFPNRKKPDQDPKCQIIAQIIQEMAELQILKTSQEEVQKNAVHQYEFLSKKEKLPLSTVEDLIFKMYLKDINPKIAKKFFSFRLVKEDVKKLARLFLVVNNENDDVDATIPEEISENDTNKSQFEEKVMFVADLF